MEPSPREIVVQTLEFAGPPRIPRQLWILPWAHDHHGAELARIQRRFPDDLVSAPPFLHSAPATSGDPYQVGRYVDEWGCTFENLQEGIIGEVRAPLIASWSEAARLRPPAERLSIDRARIDAFCRESGRFVLAGCCPRPFERLQFLRGPENLYLDLAERRPELEKLLERLHAFYLEELEVWARTRVDALVFMDDWGSQRGLLISPALWRELFKPLYRAYIELAHEHGKYAFMHSDGCIDSIFEDLVELGLDAINSQVFCMDPRELGERFGGRITFWGEMDRQRLLPRGTPTEVRAAALALRAAFWRDGGLIAQCEFGAGARPANVRAFFETLDGSGGA